MQFASTVAGTIGLLHLSQKYYPQVIVIRLLNTPYRIDAMVQEVNLYAIWHNEHRPHSFLDGWRAWDAYVPYWHLQNILIAFRYGVVQYIRDAIVANHSQESLYYPDGCRIFSALSHSAACWPIGYPLRVNERKNSR